MLTKKNLNIFEKNLCHSPKIFFLKPQIYPIFGWSFFFSHLSNKSIKGDATKIEESVPNPTPIAITREKLKRTDPPKKTSANNTRSVVPEVRVVLLKVILTE